MKYFAILIVGVLLVGCGDREVIVIKSAPEPDVVILPNVQGKMKKDVEIKNDNGETNKSDLAQCNWTFTKKFDANDIAMTRGGIRFVENFTGMKFNQNFHNVYWSDDMLLSLGTNQRLYGMTVYFKKREKWHAYIGVASELKPQTLHNLNQTRDFIKTVVHEFDHAENLTVEAIVRAKINATIDMAFDYGCAMKITNQHPFQLEVYTNKPYDFVIEKAAFDAGIDAPWHYKRDYERPVQPFFRIIRQIIQIVDTNNISTNTVITNPTPLISVTNNVSTNNVEEPNE